MKNAILGLLLMHSPSNIDRIQLMLKRRFPKIYTKNSNLTMIHRHLKEMKTLGIVISETKQETLYSVKEEFRKFCVWQLEQSRKEGMKMPDILFDFTSPMVKHFMEVALLPSQSSHP